jgi:hypothetical protein
MGASSMADVDAVLPANSKRHSRVGQSWLAGSKATDLPLLACSLAAQHIQSVLAAAALSLWRCFVFCRVFCCFALLFDGFA